MFRSAICNWTPSGAIGRRIFSRAYDLLGVNCGIGHPFSVSFNFPFIELCPPIIFLAHRPGRYHVDGNPCANGAHNWTARKDLYPDGLAPVRADGVPLLLYSSYFCPGTQRLGDF